MDFNKKWQIIGYVLLPVSGTPLIIFLSYLFSGKLISDQINIYLIYSIIYVVTVISSLILVEYKIIKSRDVKIKSNSREIDSSINKFGEIHLANKTVDIILTVYTLIIMFYLFDVLILRAKYAKYPEYGIGFIPLFINVIAFAILNYSLAKDRRFRFHWAWDIFILIILGFMYFGHAYSWNAVIPDEYIWAGPASVIVVFIVMLLDMKRMAKVPFGLR